MKKVLAELHQLINSLEDHGLTAEASSLQEVFVRVAQKADPNDLSEKVTDLLGKYSAPELIAALAEQMDSKDTKTMSFAYGEEPRDVIVNEFVDQAKNKDMRQDDAYFMMNQRLQFNGHPTLTKQEFDAKVNSSGTNISEFAFGGESDSNANGTKMVPYPEQTPEHREKVLKDFNKKMDEMNEYYDKNIPWTTAPMPYSSLSSENFYEKKMREVLAQIHNIAIQLENKKAFKQADKLNNIFIKIAEEVEAAKKKKKTKKNVPNNPSLWAACKAWAKRTFDVYPCVPLDSQALTKNGWAEYSDLNVGDEILTYNQNIDRLEWKPIIKLHFYEDAPTLSMKKAQTNFKIRCTPDHKWVLKTPNVKYPNNLVEAKNITKRMDLKTSAEIVDNVNENLDLSNWRKGDDWVKNVLSMSKPQLEAFFASGIVYDGNDKGISSLNRSTYGFSQKNSNHGQAMEIAAVLLGYRVSFIQKLHNPGMISWTFIKRDSEGTGNLIIAEDVNCDVWCPETENNTWVMKQGRIITITGNSAYANGAAAKRYKAKGGTWKKASNDSQIRTAMSHDDIFTKLYNLIDHLDENMDDSSLDEIKKLIEKLDHSDEKQDLNDHEDMTIEAEMNLEDALNNFDSGLYLVDPHGDWQEDEWISIDEYIELLEKKFGDNILDAPAAIDANHIAFESPDGFQVINLVHKSMLDTGDKGPIPDED